MINFASFNYILSGKNSYAKASNNAQSPIKKSLVSNPITNASKLSFGSSQLPSDPLDVDLFILDFDGTIGDTRKLHEEAWLRLTNELAIEKNNDAYRITKKEENENAGLSRSEMLDFILARGNDEFTKDDKDKLDKKKAKYFKEALQRYINEKRQDELLIPGAREFIETLVNSGRKMIIATNSKGAVDILEATDLDKHFNKKDPKHPTLIDGNDKGKIFKNSKPESDIFLAAADLNGVPYHKCAVFEDSKEGFEASKNAGMQCVKIGNAESKDLPIFYEAKDFRKINKYFDRLFKISNEEDKKVDYVA